MRYKIDESIKRVKTGFTLDPKIIKIMDAYIEKSTHKNRSRYIEHLIIKDLMDQKLISISIKDYRKEVLELLLTD